MDPSKLKVVELRAELIARGLDSKGVKAILVERLRAVLDDGNGVTSVPREEPTTPTRVSRNKRTPSTTQSPSPVKENMNLDTSHDELTEEDDEEIKSSDPLAEQSDNQQNTSMDTIDNEITMKKIIDEKQESIEEIKPSIEETNIIPDKIITAEEKFAIENEFDEPIFDENSSSNFKKEDEEMDHDDVHNDDDEIDNIEEEEEEADNDKETNFDENILDETEPDIYIESKSNIINDTNSNNVNEINEENKKTEESKTESTDHHILNKSPKEEHHENDTDHNEISTQIKKDQNVPETVNSIKPRTIDEETITEKSSSVKEEHKNEANHKRDDLSNRKTRKRSRSGSSRDRRRSPSIIIPNMPAQNIDDFIQEEDEPDINNDILLLNWYDSDLHLKINTKDFLSAKPMSEAALGLAWAGVRANHGIREGKVVYEVRITENNHVSNFPDEKHLHELRCGWSTLKSDLLLGENPLSFAYNGCGKKAIDNKFEDYGKSFGLNDIIGVYLDLDSTPCSIQYTVNGKSQGEAFSFDKSTLEDNALFPHISSKNVGFSVNFGQLEHSMLHSIKPVDTIKNTVDIVKKEKSEVADEPNKETETEKDPTNIKTDETSLTEDNEDAQLTEESEVKIEKTEESEFKSEIVEDVEMKSEIVEEDKDQSNENGEKIQENIEEEVVLYTILPNYEFISRLPKEAYYKGPTRPESRKDCEVIMMIGLPGAGKTYWAGNWAKQHPEKMYNILGTNSLLERMKIFGQPRRSNHIGRWEKLIEWCSRSLIVLQDIACKRRRNYILDQTNVYPAAQRRKMKGFGHFKRIAVAVIPKEEDLKKRIEEKTEIEKKDIPDTAVNEMKANFAMPSSEFGWFDEVRYTDLEGEDAMKEVIKYNEKGKKALPLPLNNPKRSRGPNYRDKRDEFKDRRASRWGAAGDRRVPGGNDRWRGPAGPPSRGWASRDQGYGGGSGGGGGGYDRRDRNWGNHGNWSQNRGPPRSSYNSDRNFRGSSNRMGQSSSSRDYNRDRDQRRTGSRSSRERDYRNSSESRDSRRSGNGYQRNGSGSGLKILKDVDNSRSSSQSNKNYSSTSSSQGQGNWGSSTNNQNWGGSNQNQWSGYYGQNYNQNWANYGNNSGWGAGNNTGGGQWNASGSNSGTNQQTQPNSSGGQWKNYGASSNTSSANTNANVATANVNSQNPQQQQQWYNWWHQQQTNSSNNGQQQHQQQSTTTGNQPSDPNAASTWQNWAQYYAGYNTGAPGSNPTKNSSTNNSGDGSKK